MEKKKFFRKWILLGLFIAVVMIFSLREREKYKYETAEFYAMDTYFTMRAYGPSAEQALADCEKVVRELEGLLSVTDEQSDIWRINHEKSAAVAQETYALISDACSYGERTGGALDITLYPVLQEWGFTTGEYRIPEEDRLKELLDNVDYRQVSLKTLADGKKSLPGKPQELYMVHIPENVQIDLGAVAKGYTGDALLNVLRQNGVNSAILDLGGNVQTLGTKPDGSLWRVAVRNPFDRGSQIGILEINDKCVITSGSYERYFTGEDGRDYWHILDPGDGHPADNGLVSVTVVGKRGEECDALSTALFVMGKERAMEFWRGQQESGKEDPDRMDFDMILVTDQGKLYMTQGLEGCFTCEEGWDVETVFLEN